MMIVARDKWRHIDLGFVPSSINFFKVNFFIYQFSIKKICTPDFTFNRNGVTWYVIENGGGTNKIGPNILGVVGQTLLGV